MGASKAASPISRRAFSPPERSLAGVSIFSVARPICATRARTLASGASGMRRRTCSTALWVGIRSSSWCCAKKPTLRFGAIFNSPDSARSRPEMNLAKVDLPLPFDAEQRDAIVGVDPQVEALEDRFAGLVSDGTAGDGDDRRCGLLLRLWEGEALDVILDHGRNRTHALQRLDAALRLAGLGGLGLEAVDEALQVLSRRVVLGLRLHLQLVGFRLLSLELVVRPAIVGRASSGRDARWR